MMFSKMMDSQSPNYGERIKTIPEQLDRLIYDNMLAFKDNDPISDMNRIALYQYCFQSNDYYYDNWVDDEIQGFIIAYFKHERTPKDLFHTDHRYILDYVVKSWFIEIKVDKAIKQAENENNPLAWLKISSYKLDSEAFGDIPADDKDRMLRLAQRKLESIKTMYNFRVIYPRESYTKKQDVYKMEKALYDRVLFNRVNRVDEKLNDSSYWEPEGFIAIFKNIIIIQSELKKGVFIALYLALKEVEWTHFQLLFPKIKDDAQKNYDTFYLLYLLQHFGNGLATDK